MRRFEQIRARLEWEEVEGGNVRNMQQFIGAGAWDGGAILKQHQRLVDESLGESDGVLVVDDSGFPKFFNQSRVT